MNRSCAIILVISLFAVTTTTVQVKPCGCQVHLSGHLPQVIPKTRQKFYAVFNGGRTVT